VRTLIPFAAALVAGLLLPLPFFGKGSAHADGAVSRSDILSVKDLRRGMKGYGLTVFEGMKPERFEVEIIDVLQNFRPRHELILIKTKHPRLEVANVVAGMSGSPIFIDGKMIGAYAYGWTFGKEPVAGVTPIRTMLDDLERPLPKEIDGWPLRPLPQAGQKAQASKTASVGTRHAGRVTFTPRARSAWVSAANRYRGEVASYDLQKHANQLKKLHQGLGSNSVGAIAPVSTPLLVGGMTPGSIKLAKELLEPMGLEPLQAGGGVELDPAAPMRYENGGAVGVQMIRGDMSAMGLGTVTRVEGDKVLAFGHPMNQSGVTALPTAIGKVLWFLASEMRSFKIGMAARPMGALVNDRQASIVLSHTAQAPVIPVTMKIKGLQGPIHTTWKFDVAHEKFMTPSFLAIAFGSALQAVASEKMDVSWDAKSRLKIKGHGEIKLEDFGVSVGATPEAGDFIRSNLVRAAGALLNSPWEPVIIESAEMEIELRFAREILRLRGAEVLEPEIDAGEPARIRLTFVPYAGQPITRVITVPIPRHLAGQTVSLEISPGYTENKEKADPESLSDLVRNLEDTTYPPKSILVSFSAGSAAVAFKGHVVRNLPPGAMDAIRPTTSSIAPEAFQSDERVVVPLGQYMTGSDRVSVIVRPVLR
jgi:hypothetical protein